MAETTEREPTEYVVLRKTTDAKTQSAPAGMDVDEQELDRLRVRETWVVLERVKATSAAAARKQVVRADIEGLKDATLVAVPAGSWQPQKPQIRNPEPVIEFLDA
jgi:hypothetical protein